MQDAYYTYFGNSAIVYDHRRWSMLLFMRVWGRDILKKLMDEKIKLSAQDRVVWGRIQQLTFIDKEWQI